MKSHRRYVAPSLSMESLPRKDFNRSSRSETTTVIGKCHRCNQCFGSEEGLPVKFQDPPIRSCTALEKKTDDLCMQSVRGAEKNARRKICLFCYDSDNSLAISISSESGNNVHISNFHLPTFTCEILSSNSHYRTLTFNLLLSKTYFPSFTFKFSFVFKVPLSNSHHPISTV